ncbi:hypothetical protein A4X06_0g4446, partial [Tilletia controversa]
VVISHNTQPDRRAFRHAFAASFVYLDHPSQPQGGNLSTRRVTAATPSPRKQGSSLFRRKIGLPRNRQEGPRNPPADNPAHALGLRLSGFDRLDEYLLARILAG